MAMTRVEAFEMACRTAEHIRHPLAHAQAVVEAYELFCNAPERQKQNPHAERGKAFAGTNAADRIVA